MKKLFSLLLTLGLLISISSCHKFLIPIPHPPAPPLDSTTKRLTGATWVYYEYFTRFDSTVTTLAWKTHRTSNTLNFALNQVKFNRDSTYTEIDQNGTIFNGTWSYLNNETQVKVVNSQGTFISTIQTLTDKRYEWLAANGNYGVMVPRNQTFDTTAGRLQLLTSKTWVYAEYFYNYGATAPSLAWKPNKANSPLNLSLNVVKFNLDGSYSETDQLGNVYNGTWAFLNNQTGTQVNSTQGTFTSTIQRLDSTRYEWLDSVSGHYGEMVPR